MNKQTKTCSLCRILQLIVVLLLLGFEFGQAQDLFFEKITDPSFSIDTPIKGITKDSLGYMWFGTWNGLYRYNGESFDTYKFPLGADRLISNNRLRTVVTDENQQIWIYTSDRKYIKYQYSLNNFILIEKQYVPEQVKVLLESSSNDLNKNKVIDQSSYFIDNNYFCSVDVQTSKRTIYYPDIFQPGHLRDEYVSAYYIDNQGIIWIGTRNGNIYKANTKRNPFKLHSIYKEGKHTPILTAVTSIYKDDQELWIGTEYDGILVMDEDAAGFKNHPVNKGDLKIDQPKVIKKDNYGNIWIGAMDGLYRYSKNDKKLKVIMNKRTKTKVNVPYVYSLSDPAGDFIWAGVYNGLAKINLQTLEVKLYDQHLIFGNRAVRDLVVDRHKNVWAGTEGFGLTRFSYDSLGRSSDMLRIKDFKELTGRNLDGDCIYSVYEDSYGKIWVGTTEGLFCIEPSTMKVDLYAETEGLPDIYITAVTEDSRGNIWVSHKKGISKIHQTDRSISNYSISDDSGNWVFKESSCFNDRENNIIYFGANEGFVSFDPNKIKSNPYAPRLLLSKLYMSGNEVVPGDVVNERMILEKALFLSDEIVLDYNSRDIGLDLTALNFQNTIGHTYQYQLEGYHDGWMSTKFGHISLLKLPPGEYTFKAQVISSDRLISNPVNLKIVILAPWYATKAAFALYILFVGLILFIWYSIRRAREKMRNQLLVERMNSEKQQEITRERLEFFTNVSHELRTPLSLIVDPLRQLQDKKISRDKQSDYIELISKNVGHLSQLINQILDFRKAEEKKLHPKYSVQDGVKVIQDTVMSFDPMAKSRGIQLTFESSRRDVVGYFDEEKLRQIVLNLLSNAFKYTPDQGAIGVSVCENLSGGQIDVEIQDNGIGIEKQALKNIFEPFNNEGSTPFYGESSGMGLALTRNLVELLGGKITVESKSKQGTLVKFSLPYKKAEEPVVEAVDQQDEEVRLSTPLEEAVESDKRPTILIVEDNADLQYYLKTELMDQYHILCEGNGVDGLNVAVTNIPDLIISDVMMPKMDGNKMCKHIKTNDKTSHIPVILLTAKGTDQDRVEGLSIGADVYFSKPFNIEVLKAQIVSIIENRINLQKSLAQKKHIVELESEQNELDNRFLQSAIDLVQQNIDVVGYNPEQLAEQLKVSQRQLYRKLKAITGSTVNEFIIRVRMEKAADLLKTENLNVSEIAYRVGFSEPSNFSRTFRKHFGCSPSNYLDTYN